MQYAPLGRSGLKVSRLCLGTMNFGPRTAEPDAHAILDAALDDGINFIDTADIYGSRGGTEEIVGRWLEKSGRRDDVVLATKVYEPMGSGPNDRGLSAWHIRRACEASLRRLRTDHIDLYQMHHIDRSVPWDEIWQAMDTLIAQGKITYVGSSNFAGWQITAAQERSRSAASIGLVSEQALYNLCERRAEMEVLPACEAYGLGVMVWSPLNRGVLAGILSTSSSGRRAGEEAQSELAKYRSQVERYESLCAELGRPPADVALAWLLHQPAVTCPIVGPGTVAHLREAERALDLELDDTVLARLDEIWPGPGPSPEAYAW